METSSSSSAAPDCASGAATGAALCPASTETVRRILATVAPNFEMESDGLASFRKTMHEFLAMIANEASSRPDAVQHVSIIRPCDIEIAVRIKMVVSPGGLAERAILSASRAELKYSRGGRDFILEFDGQHQIHGRALSGQANVLQSSGLSDSDHGVHIYLSVVVLKRPSFASFKKR